MTDKIYLLVGADDRYGQDWVVGWVETEDEAQEALDILRAENTYATFLYTPEPRFQCDE